MALDFSDPKSVDINDLYVYRRRASHGRPSGSGFRLNHPAFCDDVRDVAEDVRARQIRHEWANILTASCRERVVEFLRDFIRTGRHPAEDRSILCTFSADEQEPWGDHIVPINGYGAKVWDNHLGRDAIVSVELVTLAEEELKELQEQFSHLVDFLSTKVELDKDSGVLTAAMTVRIRNPFV